MPFTAKRVDEAAGSAEANVAREKTRRTGAVTARPEPAQLTRYSSAIGQADPRKSVGDDILHRPAASLGSRSMSGSSPSAWERPEVARSYLFGTRAALPLAHEQLKLLRALLRQNARPLRRALDLGTGDGILAQLILDGHPSARAVALDLSEPMLESARRRLAHYGDRALIAKADLRDSGCLTKVGGGERFDAVVSGFCIHHLQDRRKYALYQEIFAVLQPGGIFLNLDHVASATTWGEQLFDEEMIRALTRFERTIKDPRSPAEVRRAYLARPDKAENILQSAEVQCGWLREVGFERVDVYFRWLEFALFGGVRPRGEAHHALDLPGPLAPAERRTVSRRRAERA